MTKADLELELDELEEAAELTLQEEKEEEKEEKQPEQNLADIMQKKLVINPVDSDDSSDSDDSTDSDDSSESESDTESTDKSWTNANSLWTQVPDLIYTFFSEICLGCIKDKIIRFLGKLKYKSRIESLV